MTTSSTSPAADPNSPDSQNWFTFRRFSLLLGVLVIVMFPGVILGQSTFFFRDFQLFAYPWAHFFRESFWNGEVPLWNSLNNCGLPFLAQWNTMTLYPPSLFYLVFPLSWSLGVFCLLHLFLGGLGMYRLAYGWTSDGWASALAGLMFAFSGLMQNSLMWSNTGAALAWMPWVVLLVPRAWREGRLAGAVVVASLQMLAGSPEIILLTWVLLACLWISDAARKRVAFGTIAWRTAIVVLFVVGSCAIQLLPFLDLLLHSHRDPQFADATLWPMPVWGWANFLVPLFFTFPWSQNVHFQYDQYWTSSYYAGIGTILLASIALGQFRQPRVRVLTLVLVASLLLALGPNTFLYAWVMNALPGLGLMRYPVKFVVLAALILPLLASLAAARFSTASGKEAAPARRSLMIGTAVILCGIGAILWFARFHPRYSGEYNQWGATFANGWTRALLLIVFAGGLLGLLQVHRVRFRNGLRLGLLLLVWLDASTHAPNLAPTQERWAYQAIEKSTLPDPGDRRVMTSPEAELAMHKSKGGKSEEAFLTKRLGLYCNCNLIDGIPKVNGVFSLHLRHTEQVSRLLYAPGQEPSRGLERMLGVSMVTAPGKTMEWTERMNSLPFISSGQTALFASEDETLKGLQGTGFDPSQTVYLPEEARGSVVVAGGSPLRIELREQASQRIVAGTEGTAPALAVISQSYYHPWKAYIDGEPVPLWRANHAFQAVVIPAGKHELKLVYEDRAFRFGALTSVMTLLIGGIALSLRRRQKEA